MSNIPPFVYLPRSSSAEPFPTDTGGSTDSTEPDTKQFQKNKFQIGKELIHFYREVGETGKIFIPAEMLEKLTLLSVDSAKALMAVDD
jgi:hypothetical protein